MAITSAQASVSLGFLTIVQEGNSFSGGYLVTNFWGRPLEFRLSSAVVPNRIHQILYGNTLESHVCGELIGKTLIEKCSAQPQLVVTDRSLALSVRHHVATPVTWITLSQEKTDIPDACRVRDAKPPAAAIYVGHDRAGDVAVVRELLSKIEPAIDLSEPFVRIREAMTEARKMGVMNRAS